MNENQHRNRIRRRKYDLNGKAINQSLRNIQGTQAIGVGGELGEKKCAGAKFMSLSNLSPLKIGLVLSMGLNKYKC